MGAGGLLVTERSGTFFHAVALNGLVVVRVGWGVPR